MNDGKVHAAIEQLEAWTADPAWEPDSELLSQWNADFQAALAQAEKAEGWPGWVARAHAIAEQIELRVTQLAKMQDELRVELDSHERGDRALKGYGASAR
jgi:hypothetical protein